MYHLFKFIFDVVLMIWTIVNAHFNAFQMIFSIYSNLLPQCNNYLSNNYIIGIISKSFFSCK